MGGVRRLNANKAGREKGFQDKRRQKLNARVRNRTIFSPKLNKMNKKKETDKSRNMM